MPTTSIARVFRPRNVFYFACFVLLSLWATFQVHAYYIYKRYGLQRGAAQPRGSGRSAKEQNVGSISIGLQRTPLRYRPPPPPLTRALRIQRGGAGRQAARHEQVARPLQAFQQFVRLTVAPLKLPPNVPFRFLELGVCVECLFLSLLR